MRLSAGPDNEKYNKLKYMLMSFSLSFFIFSLALMAMIRYGVQDRAAGPAEAAAALEEAYAPSKEDALTVLFMGMATMDSPPGLYMLAKFDPLAEAVTVLILPPETAVQNNGGQETLAEVYKYGGASYTKNALAQTLGIDIDRFARLDYAAFITIADAIGSVEANLESDVRIETGGAQMDMRAGLQLLNGQRLLALMLAYNASQDLEDKYALLGKLCLEIINQRIDIALSTTYTQAFEKIIGIIDTDISYIDFHSRIEASAWLARRPDPAVLLTASGTWDGGLYVLGDTFIAEAAEKMG